ncbi:hypothetical protein A2U01_0089669, partial [Trifolium medium]|nr:hypothetical protein [Trifolium medium]
MKAKNNAMTRGRGRPKKPVPPSTPNPLQTGETSHRTGGIKAETVPLAEPHGENEDGEDDT